MRALPGSVGFDPKAFNGQTIDINAATGQAKQSWGARAQNSAGSTMKGLGRVGKLAGRAAPVLFAGLDYAAGKAEGEDNIRAAAGAAGSAGGGWAGAAAGASAGAAIGSFIPVPVVGTAIGGIVGGLIGGAAGSMAGGWGADRIDDVVRGKPPFDRNTSPIDKVGMLKGAASNVSENDMLGGLGRGLLTAGAGIGAIGAGMGLKGAMSGNNNEFDQRQQQAQAGLMNDMNQSLNSDVQQGIYVGERAGNFKRGLEQDRMNQEYNNQLGIQGQQLQASQAQDELNAFVQTQNTAAQRAQSILNTRFY